MKAAARKPSNTRKGPAAARLAHVLNELPPDQQQQVLDFAQALLTKKSKKKSRKLKLDWMGGLKEFRNQYTSLELQKQALQWRIEHATRRH